VRQASRGEPVFACAHAAPEDKAAGNFWGKLGGDAALRRMVLTECVIIASGGTTVAAQRAGGRVLLAVTTLAVLKAYAQNLNG